MELTRTNAVFSRTAMVLFFVQNKKFSESPENQRRFILEYIKNICKKIHTRGPTPCPRGWGRPPPRERPLPSGPLVLHRRIPRSYIFTFGEKKIREKELSCFTIRSRRQALISLGRADLESVRGSEEWRSSPSSSSTFLHHQFHDAHRRA